MRCPRCQLEVKAGEVRCPRCRENLLACQSCKGNCLQCASDKKEK